jgi:hypothetical protein
VLTGTASISELAARAPTMLSLEPLPIELKSTEVLQAIFEMSYSSRECTLPPALHPTTPPLMIILAWRAPESPWGPFSMAQIRVSCRSGVRPRGFVVDCLVDSSDAADALSQHWGLPTRLGPVTLAHFYDSVALDAGPALRLIGLDPDPLGSRDVQYTVTTTLAHTPRGLRLVQLEPEYDLSRVERVRPRLESFDAGRWAPLSLSPRHAVTASVAVGTVTMPKLRFVSLPDVSAFEGTETV